MPVTPMSETPQSETSEVETPLMNTEMTEVLIVGGGPAGLSAALVLGRARRKVILCDSRVYRNASSKAMHGFLSRDGMPPKEFLETARSQLKTYESVQRLECSVEDIRKDEGQFTASISAGKKIIARKVILATGLVDILPAVEGALDIYGNGLHHCPYCDGYEVQDQPLCIYGKGDAKGAGLALELTQWSRSLTLCTDGPSEISASLLEQLRRFDIRIDERPLRRFSKDGENVRIQFQDGKDEICKAVFFNIGTKKASDLAERLGCEIVKENAKPAEQIAGKTCVDGVYIVGDASRDVLQVIVAAGEGSAAAIALNAELLRDDGVML